jgi:hypothetical protein
MSRRVAVLVEVLRQEMARDWHHAAEAHRATRH